MSRRPYSAGSTSRRKIARGAVLALLVAVGTLNPGPRDAAASEADGEVTPRAESPAMPPMDPKRRAARIIVLETAISRDQETLLALLAEPVVPEAPALRDHPELRAIAKRLPILQADLFAERAAADEASALAHP